MKKLEKIALTEFKELSNAELRMTRGGADSSSSLIECSSASTPEQCTYYGKHYRCEKPSSEYYTPGSCGWGNANSCQCKGDWDPS